MLFHLLAAHGVWVQRSETLRPGMTYNALVTGKGQPLLPAGGQDTAITSRMFFPFPVPFSPSSHFPYLSPLELCRPHSNMSHWFRV